MSHHIEHGQNFWQVKVSGLLNGDIEACLADSAIAGRFMSAESPSHHLELALMPEATEADATRIAQCLAMALPNNKVTIHRSTYVMPSPQGPPMVGAIPADPHPSATAPLGPSSSQSQALNARDIWKQNGKYLHG
jgi:hypothetical protein